MDKSTRPLLPPTSPPTRVQDPSISGSPSPVSGMSLPGCRVPRTRFSYPSPAVATLPTHLHHFSRARRYVLAAWLSLWCAGLYWLELADNFTSWQTPTTHACYNNRHKTLRTTPGHGTRDGYTTEERSRCVAQKRECLVVQVVG
jgi:hypothetical protein